MIKLADLVKNWFINMSYYAVARGRFPGIYFTWADCKKQVDHFPGAKYRRFSSEREARDFVAEFQNNASVVSSAPVPVTQPLQLNKQFVGLASHPEHEVSKSVPVVDKNVLQNGEELSLVALQKQVTQLEEKQKLLKKRMKAELGELRQMLDERLSKIEAKFLNQQNVDHSTVTSSLSDITKVEKIFDEEFGLIKEKLNNLKDKKISVNNSDDTKTHRQKLKEALQEQNVPKALGARSLAVTSSSLPPDCPSGKRKFSTSGTEEEKTVKVLVKDCNTAPFIVDDDGYVVVYTDGACEQNGKRGARAGIGVWFGENHPLNISEPVVGKATNNMAEIQAATYAVETAKKAGVKKLLIHTDSKFLINCITEWINKWKKNDWHVTGGQPVKNKDELIVLDNKLQGIDVKWKHVRGHCGLHGNEMADYLAREGAKRYMQIDCDEDF